MNTIKRGRTRTYTEKIQIIPSSCYIHNAACNTKCHTLWAIKRSQLIFVCNFVKNQQILMQFSLLDLTMNDMWWYKLHPPHLINVATLPCESRNFKQNIINTAIDQWCDHLRLIMCACYWRTLWTHAVKLVFIYIMWFITTFCENVNVI